MAKHLFLFLLICLRLIGVAQDSEPVISGDRPGFGVSTANLQKGTFQVESGVQWDGFWVKSPYRDNPFFVNYHSIYNFTTLRYGVGDRIEIKMDVSGGYYDFTGAGTGFTNDYWAFQSPAIGTRITLLDDTEIGRLLLYGTGTLPFLSSFDDERFAYDARLLYTKSLCDNTSLDINVGLTQNRTEDDQPPFFHSALAVTQGVCDRWSIFGEAYIYTDFVFIDNWIDGGVIFNPTPSTQLDFSIGYRLELQRNAELNPYRQVFVNMGGAVRL